MSLNVPFLTRKCFHGVHVPCVAVRLPLKEARVHQVQLRGRSAGHLLTILLHSNALSFYFLRLALLRRFDMNMKKRQGNTFLA